MIRGYWILIAALSSSSSLVAQGALFGEYYNNNTSAGASPPPPPGSPAGTTFTGAPVLRRADADVNFNFVMNPGPAPGVNADDFMISWRGFLTVPVSGSYTFGTISDDGVRMWVNNMLVRDDWVDQGPAAAPEMGSALTLTAGVPVAIRVEMYENGGGEAAKIYWTPPGGATAAIPSSALSLPAGPTSDVTSVIASFDSQSNPTLTVTWSSVAPDIVYELQRNIDGGAWTTLLSGVTDTTFSETAAVFDVPYYYRVRATQYGILVGPYSDGLDSGVPIAPPVRFNDHEEGVNDGNCACGSTAGGVSTAAAALAALVLFVALRSRPS